MRWPEWAVPPTNQFLLFSQISPDGCHGFDSGLASRWEITTSCYTNTGQFWKVLFMHRQPMNLIQRLVQSLDVNLKVDWNNEITLDTKEWIVPSHLFYWFLKKKSGTLGFKKCWMQYCSGSRDLIKLFRSHLNTEGKLFLQQTVFKSGSEKSNKCRSAFLLHYL